MKGVGEQVGILSSEQYMDSADIRKALGVQGVSSCENHVGGAEAQKCQLQTAISDRIIRNASQKMLGAGKDRGQEFLGNNYQAFVDGIQFPTIFIRELVKNGMLSESEKAMLESLEEREDKAEKVVDMLMMRFFFASLDRKRQMQEQLKKCLADSEHDKLHEMLVKSENIK